MYKKILVPVVLDDEANIRSALAVARNLLDSGGEIVLFHVMEDIPNMVASQLPAGTIERNRQEFEAQLTGIARAAGDRVVPVVVTGHASRSILGYAADNRADCIVIASHRPGLEDFFLGSTAARIVRHAGCSVHVMR